MKDHMPQKTSTKNHKWIRIIILTVLGVIADILTITSTFKRVLYWIGIEGIIAAFLNLIVLVIGFGLLAYAISLLRKARKDAGTHGIPCSWYYFWYFKRANRNDKIFKHLHYDIYHKMSGLIFKIRKTKIERKNVGKNTHLTVSEFREEVGDLLHCFHDIFNDCFHLDLTINIYISSADGNDMIVKRGIFHKSDKETLGDNERDRNYKYVIHDCDAKVKNLKSYYNSAKTYSDRNRNPDHHINCIYDYIMTSDKSSWMSNNLEYEPFFFSTSDYYKEEYYKSLAVFAIIPPTIVRGVREKARGLLTFDSPKTEVFSEAECTMLMGLMAHLVFDVLQEIE